MKVGKGFLFGVLAGAVLPGIIIAVVFWPRTDSFEVVAVLPFDATGDDSTLSVLAPGIAKQLATRLTSHDAKVVPWMTSSRFGGTNLGVRDIAQELGADAIVTGTLEVGGNRVSGTIEVRNGDTEELIWSDPFERQIGDIGYLGRHLGDMYAPVIAQALLGEEPAPPPLHERQQEALALLDLAYAELDKDTQEANKPARDLYDQALVLDPESVEAYLGMATMFYRLGETREAIPMYRVAQRLAPLDPNPLRGLMRCFWRDGRYDRCLQIALEVGEGFSKLDQLIVIGEAYFYGNLPHKAVPFLERAFELDPENVGVLWVLVPAYVWSGQYEKSVEAARDYLSRKGDDYWARLFMAEAFYGLGLLDSALVHHKKARSTASTLRNMNALAIAGIYAQLGDPSKGHEVLNDTAKKLRESGEPSDRAYLPLAYALLGDEEAFEREMDWLREHFLHLDPDETPGLDGELFWWLGLAHVVLEQYDEALILMRKCIDESGNLYLPSIRADGRGQQFWAVKKLRQAPWWPELEAELQVDLERRWELYGVQLPD